MKISMAILVSAVVLMVGCVSVNKPITYSLKDIPQSSATMFKNINICVLPFADLRQQENENSVLFSGTNQLKINGVKSCVNAEIYYRDSVGTQITKMVVDHLKQKAMFQRVTFADKSSADFILSGTIKKFYGVQEFSTTALVGAQFGVIGALLTSTTKTHGKIDITLSDLNLSDKTGNAVIKLDDISEKFQGDLIADAHCWRIYSTVNEKLKVAIGSLSKALETRLVEYLKSK